VVHELKLLTVVAVAFIVGLTIGIMVAPVIPGLKQSVLETPKTSAIRQKAGKAVFGKVEGNVANITSMFRQVSMLAQKLSTTISPDKLAIGDILVALITPFLKEPLVQPLTKGLTTTIATPIATLEIQSIGAQLYTPTHIAFYEQQVENVDEPDPVKYSKLENIAYIVAGDKVVKLVSFTPQSTIVGEINVLEDAEELATKLVLVEVSNTLTRTLAKLAPEIRVEALHLAGDSLFAIAQLDYPYIPKANLTDVVLVLVYNTEERQLIDWFWVEGRYFDSRAYIDPSTGKAKLILVVVKHAWMKSFSPRTSWGEVPSNATAVIGPAPNTITIVTLYDVSTRLRSAVAVAGNIPTLVYFNPRQGLYIVYKTASLKLLKTIKEVLEELCRVLERDANIETIATKISALILSRLPREIPTPPILKTGIVKIDVLKDGLVVKHYRELDGLPVRNQFSIDLFNNTLRIVLRRIEGGFNLYVLDPVTLEQIANMTVALPGERVYGVRFIGPYLYIITYRTIDPLFAISLANPEKPKMLGWRKGPGWDEFLYPLNETAILGIGYSGKRELRVSIYKLERDGNIELCSRVVVAGERSSILFQGRYGYHALVVDREHGWILVPGMLEFVRVTVNGETQTMATLSYYLVKFDPNTLSLSQPEEISLSFTVTSLPLHRYARALVVNDTIHIITPYKVVDYQIISGKPTLVAEIELV